MCPRSYCRKVFVGFNRVNYIVNIAVVNSILKSDLNFRPFQQNNMMLET